MSYLPIRIKTNCIRGLESVSDLCLKNFPKNFFAYPNIHFESLVNIGSMVYIANSQHAMLKLARLTEYNEKFTFIIGIKTQ